jgi:hypothetical protein
MFRKGDNFYWMLTNSYDEYICLNNPINFFGDGNVPEVAVIQAYLAKQFFQENLPNLQGGLSLHQIPIELRPLYHHCLSRLPALTETIAIGTIMSKSSTLNLKNIRCIEEIISLGRMDICHSWNEKRQNLIDDLLDVPYGFRLHKTKTPIDNYKVNIDCPERILRIAALYRLDPDGLTEVSHEILQSL